MGIIVDVKRGPVSLLKAAHGPELNVFILLIASLCWSVFPCESKGVTEPLLSSTLKACLQRMQ